MKKMIAGLLILGSMVLAGCTFTNTQPAVTPPNPEPEGADWRTWGIIHSYGTIEVNGKTSAVCAVLTDSALEIYYDSAKQVLYQSIELPRTLTGDEISSAEISFEDCAEDANTDIVLTVNPDDGAAFSLTWVYNGDSGEYEYYMVTAENFQEEGRVPEEYLGLWIADFGVVYYFQIDEDGTWNETSNDDSYSDSGYALYDGEYITLYRQNGDVAKKLFCYDDSKLVDEDGGVIVREKDYVPVGK